MSQIESGVRAILSHPLIYNSLQVLLGGNRNRRDFVRNYMRPEEGDNVLDIGCGTAEILSFLPKNNHYFGFDQSEDYIEHAKARFGDSGQFICAKVDSIALSNLPKMNIVLAAGLLHHLDDEQSAILFETAKLALARGGRFIAIDPCYSDGQSPIAKWLIDRDRGNNVRTEIQYNNLAKEVFSNVESHVVHRKWVPYTHHILNCE